MVDLSHYDLIIFDWDGTLLDSVPRIVTCFQRTFEKVGVPTAEERAIRATIGLPIGPSLQQLFGKDAEVDGIYEIYREVWLDESIPWSPLFPGVLEFLEGLHGSGRPMAIATGKSRVGLQRDMERLQTAHFFGVSRCGDESEAKPSPKMLLEILEETGVAPQRALMIGDSPLDLEMATRAGIPAVGVTSGAHDEAGLAAAKPMACLTSVTEMRF